MKRLLFVLLSCIGLSVSAQDVAVKSNLLYDMTTTINFGAEVRMSSKWTLDVSANWNPWTFSGNKNGNSFLSSPKPAIGSVRHSTGIFSVHTS